jgi:hypothetical protein
MTVLTYQALSEQFEPRPNEARFGVVVLNATGSPDGDLYLPGGSIDSFEWVVPYEVVLPDIADYVWSYEASLSAAAGEIALPLLERLYAFFKNTSESIPYLNEERTAVDPDLFRRGR